MEGFSRPFTKTTHRATGMSTDGVEGQEDELLRAVANASAPGSRGP